MALVADDISINTLVGAGTKVSGDLNIAGLVRIDGDIDGNLETSGRVIIGEKARIHGNVTAKAAVIGGIVEGDVFAPEGIQLFSTSSVRGDVITKNITIAENAFVQGMCIAIKDTEQFMKDTEDWKNQKAILTKAAFSTGKI